VVLGFLKKINIVVCWFFLKKSEKLSFWEKKGENRRYGELKDMNNMFLNWLACLITPYNRGTILVFPEKYDFWRN
jgi:hypothetical protein